MVCLHHGMVAAYSVSRITHLPRWFLVAFPALFIFLSVHSPMVPVVVPNCRGFLLTSPSLVSSQLLMQTPRARPARLYRVTRT